MKKANYGRRYKYSRNFVHKRKWRSYCFLHKKNKWRHCWPCIISVERTKDLLVLLRTRLNKKYLLNK